jgi:branched-chain amino acid transport system substrate-binding protein
MKQHASRRGFLWRCALVPVVAAVSALLLTAAQAQQPVKIGFSMALTGPLAGAGQGALLAMQIWEDDVNKRGGLLGRKVELVYYDDKSNPSEVPGIYS